MSACYFCDAKPGKPHMVDCPSDGRDPWAEETKPTWPTAEQLRVAAKDVPVHHSWMGNRTPTGERVVAAGTLCEVCGLWIPDTLDTRWGSACPGPKLASQTSGSVVLSARGVATGWREVRPGVWVLDE